MYFGVLERKWVKRRGGDRVQIRKDGPKCVGQKNRHIFMRPLYKKMLHIFFKMVKGMNLYAFFQIELHHLSRFQDPKCVSDRKTDILLRDHCFEGTNRHKKLRESILKMLICWK